ncbi:hypothetical protein RJ641_035155 [Dillenia turbinata]|uniref:Uncharacterized protein n=1 Tax=Dillenia turbinata TaxID=194707 RepID=A0AAN8VJ26_9MAGN
MATERRKAKEAEAKRQLHAEKAKHAEDKRRAKYTHAHHLGFGTPHEQPSMVTGHHHFQPPVTTTVGYDTTYGNHPVGMAAPMAGTTVPAYPLGGIPAPTGRKYP